MLFRVLSRCSRMSITASVTAVVSLFFVTTVAFADADAERGRVLADTCEGCHAVESYNNVYPTYHVPRIGGQSAEYVALALTLYRDGNRSHATMTAQASSYSDQDIQDIAAYLASVIPPLTDGAAIGTAPEAALVCTSCHGETGIGQVSSYPYLAGQYQDYLEQSLLQYKSGNRKGPDAAVMQAQLMSLSDEDIKAISAFYAQQDGLQSLSAD